MNETPDRVYMWIPPSGCTGRIWHSLPTEARGRRIQRLWTILDGADPDKPPPADLALQHGLTAFLEDRVHDWNVQDSRPDELRYYSRITTGGVWIALVFRDPPGWTCTHCRVACPPGGAFCHMCGSRRT